MRDNETRNMLTHFTCIHCGEEYSPGDIKYTCPGCGGNLDARYDYEAIGRIVAAENPTLSFRNSSIWRYRAFLPLKGNVPPINLQVGMTPLTPAERLGRKFGLDRLLVKNDSLNPSGSLKDRASFVVLCHCLESGIKRITAASTGNAGSSMACMAAAGGIPSVIFVPETCPRPKVAQLLIYGAEVFSVRGDYSAAFSLCQKVSESLGWFNRNTGTNPYTREGKKTVSFEIWEQLQYELPDAVIVSVGDGNIISGVYKGFHDLLKAGLTERIPRIIGVQSTRSAAITNAFEGDGIIRRVKGDTVADSISASMPSDGEAALKAVASSGGTMIAVEDAEILESVKILARDEGIFAEPSGAACLAGLVRLMESGKVSGKERIVLLVTGHGLKDVEKALMLTGEPVSVEPDLPAVLAHIERYGNP